MRLDRAFVRLPLRVDAARLADELAAIDAGPNPVSTFTGNSTDQRGTGFPRVVNGTVDIGAFEVQPPPPVPSPAVIPPRFTG